MSGKKNDLKHGIEAMFSSSSEGPQEGQNTGNPSQERKNSRPVNLNGRRRKDDTSELLTKDDRRTTLVLNRFQYAVIKEIASRERVTIKDLVSEMFRLGIDRYEKKHGKVELDDGDRIKDIF